jgi:hypothetical protein
MSNSDPATIYLILDPSGRILGVERSRNAASEERTRLAKSYPQGALRVKPYDERKKPGEVREVVRLAPKIPA